MRRTGLASGLLLLALSAGWAHGEDAPGLWLDGEPRALQYGLGRTADGRLWIHVDDLRGALGVIVKRLIPRPPAGRWPQPHRERDSWILCNAQRCVTWRGRTLGAERQPTFDVARVAGALGYRVRTRPDSVRLTSPRPARPRTRWRASIGSRVGDLTLPCLDGRTRRLAEYRGRRLLVLTWASWSPTREELDAWRSGWPRPDQTKLDLLYVAVDIEGERYVRDHVDVGFDEVIAVDRNADLARRLYFNDVGHWFLVDEVGILRAEGERLGETERRWIELHFDEPLVDLPPPPPTQLDSDLAALHRQVAAAPRDAAARVALSEALERSDPAAARAQAAALVELKPESAPFAFRLARLHLDAGDLPGALRALDEGRRRLPHSWILRKQYWALEEPTRFYSGAIDLEWQRQKRREEAHLYRR